MPAYGPAIIQDQTTPRSALVAPGYYAPVNSPQFVTLQLLWPVVKVTPAQFDDIVTAVTKPQAVDAAVAALPAQIPLTVQGASEQFINGIAAQISSNTNQVGSVINGNNIVLAGQVKTHVTAEADRIIAAG